jgi:hypothetical protein
MNWALRRGLARFYRALFGSRVTSSPGEGGQHSQAGYPFIFLIVINPCLVTIDPNEPDFSQLLSPLAGGLQPSAEVGGSMSGQIRESGVQSGPKIAGAAWLVVYLHGGFIGGGGFKENT